MIKSFLLGLFLMVFIGFVFAITTVLLNHYQIIEYYNHWVMLGFWFGWISALIIELLPGLRKGNNNR